MTDNRYIYRVPTTLGFVLIRSHGAASAEMKADAQGYNRDGRATLATDEEIAYVKEMGEEVRA